MIFKIISTLNTHFTFVGVLEFIADENTMVLPTWIMENLDLEEGNLVIIEYTEALPKVLPNFKKNSPLGKKNQIVAS